MALPREGCWLLVNRAEAVSTAPPLCLHFFSILATETIVLPGELAIIHIIEVELPWCTESTFTVQTDLLKSVIKSGLCAGYGAKR